MVAGMVRTVVVRKRSIIIYGIIIIVLAFITVILTTYLQGNKDNGYITYARAAKMVAYAQVDDCDAFISDGDIEIREKSKSCARYKEVLEATNGRLVPEWLESDKEALKGTVKSLPTREAIDVPVNEMLIVELYSK